jgi:SSS family solute:Na+ symporter
MNIMGTGLTILDLAVMAVYVIVVVVIGFFFVRRGSSNVEAFFVSGHNLPWWLVGTSIAATSFASDTPLWVTDIVRQFGIQAAWYLWAPVWGTVITIFVTGPLLRRTMMVTDVQLAEFRYGGRYGAFLRVFSSGYYALVFNALVLSWVFAAMSFWGTELLGLDKYTAVIGGAVLALSYALFSGLWGVVATDFLQFAVATAGAIVLAILSVKQVGGVGEMVSRLQGLSAWEGRQLNILPRANSSLGLTLFCAYFGIQWILYANPLLHGAQRVLSCKSEKDVSLALIWNTVTHNLLSVWPWVIVAICSMLLFPRLADNQTAYPKMVAAVLPAGLRGLMIAAILAAFMSTVDTHLNWGTSYIVNDIYRPFIRKSASERHYLWVSRFAMLAIAAVGVILGLMLKSIVDRFQFLSGMVISFAPVLVARWFWWRVNAWSEIVAIAASAVFTFGMTLMKDWSGPEYFGHRLFTTMALTTAVWLVATFLTKPVELETLKKFYLRVRPLGFWKPVKVALGEHDTSSVGWQSWVEIAISCAVCVVFIYSSIIATGQLILGRWQHGTILGMLALFSFLFVHRKLRRIDEHQKTA